MLNGEKIIKLLVQDESDNLVFLAEEDGSWSIPTIAIESSEFPEEAVVNLVEKEFEADSNGLRLLKVVELDSVQAHLYLIRLENFPEKMKIKSVPVIEANELDLSEIDQQLVEVFAQIFYRPWGQ